MNIIILLIIVLSLGFVIPFYLYAGSLSNLLSALFITFKTFKSNKNKVILEKQKDLNKFAVLFFNEPPKEIYNLINQKNLNKFIKRAKNNNYFDVKQTKRYIRQYERYDYTFLKMYNLNIFFLKKNMKNSSKNILMSEKYFNVDKLLKKVNKKLTKHNVDSMLTSIYA